MTTEIGKATPAWQWLGLIAVATSLGAAGWPAHAEDSGFWDTVRSMSRETSVSRETQSIAPAPSWFPRQDFRRAAPRQRAARPDPQVRREIARLPEPPTISKPVDPNKRANPLVALLSDPTLRRGDIVMFPDGPRVFKGDPGTRHVMADFVGVNRDRETAPSTRKALASLPVGENNAWSSDAVTAKGRLAQGVADVETTGSLTAKGRSRR
jgi:hypothetical protein